MGKVGRGIGRTERVPDMGRFQQGSRSPKRAGEADSHLRLHFSVREIRR